MPTMTEPIATEGGIPVALRPIEPSDADECSRIVGANWGAAAAEDFAFRTFVEPDATIASLIEDVEGLGLPHGTERSLAAKLDGAEKNVANGDLDGACEKLASFSDQVAALSGKKIDADDADGLIADATAVRGQLGCTP